MRWKGRPQTDLIDDLSDPMTALIHEEMLNYTNQGVRRYIPMPWVEQQLESMGRWAPPLNTYMTGEELGERHSPGGYVRRWKRNPDGSAEWRGSEDFPLNPHPKYGLPLDE